MAPTWLAPRQAAWRMLRAADHQPVREVGCGATTLRCGGAASALDRDAQVGVSDGVHGCTTLQFREPG